VIYSDEMYLEAAVVEEWLAGQTFEADLIADVLLALSYDPARSCCPVFKLPIYRRHEGG
jgi:hypothetical protein